MEIIDLLELLKIREAELLLLDFGSVEIRKKNNNKYMYTHYMLDGDNYTKYIGEYTEEEYNKALNNNIKAKELKKNIRRIKSKINSLGYQETELSDSVKLNIDFARRNLANTIYKQAILEGISTTEIETENIIEGLKINNMTATDILKIVNLKHAWDFILDKYVISTKTNYNILCVISKLVLQGFYPYAGKLRTVPVSIGGTNWKPDFPFEADIKEDIERITNKKKSDIDIAIDLLLYVSKKQMFIDGNKRCAVIFANHYLISKGKGLITIPVNRVEEYKKLLMEYYETDKTKNIIPFLKDCYFDLTKK